MLKQNPIAERLTRICREANLPCVNINAGSSRQTSLTFSWEPHHGEPRERRYLVASITKPIVAMAAMRLVADGQLRLHDRLSALIPEFNHSGKRTITIRQLLTHTCGLPDMLVNNNELRAAHSSVKQFVATTAECTPEFAAGTNCRYSSMGFAALSRVIEHITSIPTAEYLQEQFFAPLQMQTTWLGLPANAAEQLMPTIEPCQLPIWQSESCDWSWNSLYWRTLGAPWGGLISTASDLGTYARMMLKQGCGDDGLNIIPAVAVQTATTNQTSLMTGLSNAVRQQQQWGYGWRLNWLDHSACLCELLPPTTYGHWGATGTTMWISPETDSYAVILTTTPYEISQAAIQKMSNLVAAAIL